jgi:hypothetical protein
MMYDLKTLSGTVDELLQACRQGFGFFRCRLSELSGSAVNGNGLARDLYRR